MTASEDEVNDLNKSQEAIKDEVSDLNWWQ